MAKKDAVKEAPEVVEEVAVEVAPAAEVAPVEPKEEAAPAPKGKKVSEVTVAWNGGERVYSLEVHGEHFLDLAKEFCAKHNAEIL